MIVGDGRPFRFLAMVGGGWIAIRIALAWHAIGSLPQAIREVLPIPRPADAAALPVELTRVISSPRPTVTHAVRAMPDAPSATPTALIPVNQTRVQLALLAMTQFGGAIIDAPLDGQGAAPGGRRDALSPMSGMAGPSRFSVSSWMIARGGTGIGATPLSPQLGGTQGGVRIDYTLTGGLAATGRIAAPAAGAGREVSIGIAWRPAGVPLRLVAEHRMAIDGGRSGPALGVSGGVSALPLPADFRLEGYGQAGAILRDGLEKYVDGSVRAARPVVTAAGITLDLGGGLWGGAQRSVARLDVGPSVGVRVAVAGRPTRIALDWRQRIAGNARPGSGPALTLGTDF